MAPSVSNELSHFCLRTSAFDEFPDVTSGACRFSFLGPPQVLVFGVVSTWTTLCEIAMLFSLES